MEAMVSVPGVEVLGKTLEEGNRDFLRRVLLAGLREIMDAEVASRCGAPPGERSPERVNHRNGYRERDVETRRRWEDAFRNVVTEAFVCGVSTRKVEALVEALGCRGRSKSEVARIAQALDAVYLKVREGGRIRSLATRIALGVNPEGRLEVLGVDVLPLGDQHARAHGRPPAAGTFLDHRRDPRAVNSRRGKRDDGRH
jgi:transposase-like protein